ncbi:MAG: ferritin-like domain-containing protein [Proteobacteria bacterium]|nr:ferritin-like domain-containing protein [Pseudomonadota bacterium]
MSESASDSLSANHPEPEGVKVAMEAIYNWNYEPEVDELRNLYAKSLDLQWIALRDLEWDRGIDHNAFTRTFSLGGIPITETSFWKSLSDETRWDVARRSASFMLSNFLHGEQGALMVAAQLVNAVPHMDGKFYASTQTLDEARHVEVFAKYVSLLDNVYPISPGLKKLLDGVLSTENWMMKAVGMQVVTEGLALYSFRDMRNQTEEPLLKQLLTYVSRDEARHTGYGIKYLNRVVPTLSDKERSDLEDFAFEAARLLIDQRAGYSMRETIFQLWKDAGVDPGDALTSMLKEREVIQQALAKGGGRFGPVSGFVIPTLRSIGLYSDRIAEHFKEMWTANVGAETADRLASNVDEVPEDLEAWVNEGYEAL